MFTYAKIFTNWCIDMWKASYILEQAKREDKGKWNIYALYISLLKQSDTADFEADKKKLKEILEV